MAKEKGGRNGKRNFPEHQLHPHAKNGIWAASFLCVAAVLTLAGFAKAGPAGDLLFKGLEMLFGWGYFILPTALAFAAAVLLFAGRQRIIGITSFGAGLFALSVLALIELFSPGKGGWLGLIFGSLR